MQCPERAHQAPAASSFVDSIHLTSTSIGTTCRVPCHRCCSGCANALQRQNPCEIFVPYRKSKTSFEIYRDGGSIDSVRMLIKMVMVVRAFRNRMDEELRKMGQGSARMETLGAIMNMQGAKSQSDVAKRLRVESATITRMVDILSSEGLVVRSPDPSDRRVNLLSVSPKGEEVLREIFTVYDAVREHILTDLPEQEYDRLHDIFDKMLKRLDKPLDGSVKIDD